MRKRILFFVIMLMFIPFNVFAEKMIFVTGGMSPPYVYEKGKEIKGIDVEVVKEFCRQNGIDPEFAAYPWKRALKYVKEGNAHGIFSLFKTEEREEFLYYPSVPINKVKTVVIARKEDHIKISNLSDLLNKDVGVINGYKYGPEFDNFPGIKKTFCRDKKQMISIFDRGRVDIILDSEAVFQFKCKEYGFDPDKFEVVYVVRENPIYIAFSKSALGRRGDVLSEKFSLFFKEIEKNGVLEKIQDNCR